MICRSDLQAEQLHILQNRLFGNRNVVEVTFPYQLRICIDGCKLHAQGFLKNMDEQKLGCNY